MGIPFLVSRSGLTQMGYEIARKVGITMIGRATNRHYLLFTGAAALSRPTEDDRDRRSGRPRRSPRPLHVRRGALRRALPVALLPRTATARAAAARTRAAFVTWVGFPSAQVRVTAGADALGDARVVAGHPAHVLPPCGTKLFFESERWPGETHVALAGVRRSRRPGAGGPRVLRRARRTGSTGRSCRRRCRESTAPRRHRHRARRRAGPAHGRRRQGSRRCSTAGRWSRTCSTASRRRSTRSLINANQNLERYAAFGHPVVPDAVGGFAGPLAGLHAGMPPPRRAFVVTVPCDSPFLPADLVARLARRTRRDGRASSRSRAPSTSRIRCSRSCAAACCRTSPRSSPAAAARSTRGTRRSRSSRPPSTTKPTRSATSTRATSSLPPRGADPRGGR